MSVRNDDVPEELLAGGNVNLVTRVGDTVRRAPCENARFVRRLLGHLAEAGWSGAPRYLGVDESGREILDFLPGHVAWDPEQPYEISSDGSLVALGTLVRQFHDLTADSPLAADQEVVCHNDLSPRNTVCRDSGAGLWPVAFIDWDIAAPGPRIHDVAHCCWQFLRLGPHLGEGGGVGGDPAENEPAGAVTEASRRMRVLCDAYGLRERSALIDTIMWWQRRCARGIESKAERGEPAMVRLRDRGVPGAIREAEQWVRDNRQGLHAHLR